MNCDCKNDRKRCVCGATMEYGGPDTGGDGRYIPAGWACPECLTFIVDEDALERERKGRMVPAPLPPLVRIGNKGYETDHLGRALDVLA